MQRPIGVGFLAVVVAVVAHWQSVSEDFDKTKIVTIRGTVEGFVSPGPAGPHFYIRLGVKNPQGAIEHWLLEGKSRAALLEAGWTFGDGGLVQSGDTIVATAYALKSTADVKDALSVLPPGLREKVQVDHLAHGIEITLSTGRKMPFGEQ
jgi:uncharacterized protein DUF6152